MIKNNFLGQIMIGIIVLFLLISSIQMFGWGLGINKIQIDENSIAGLPKVPQNTSSENQVANVDSKLLLEEIGTRPMFSSDRKPFVEIEIEVVDEPQEEVDELKVKLTGVVITPEQSYAMILDPATNQRETYQVGMPLDGEQGGWTLNSIQSRKVTFVSDDNQTAELELEVYSKKLKAGKQASSMSNSSEKSEKDQKQKDTSREEKKKNADDIRKKIAERRAQMRAEAAKKNK